MKNLKYYLSVLVVVFTVNSCDVLDEDPFTQPSTENFYQNETDETISFSLILATKAGTLIENSKTEAL